MLAFPYLKYPPADHFETESMNAVQSADVRIRRLVEATQRQWASMEQTVERAYRTGQNLPLELAELCHQQNREIERLINGFLTLIDSILASPRAYLLSDHAQWYLKTSSEQTRDYLRAGMAVTLDHLDRQFEELCGGEIPGVSSDSPLTASIRINVEAMLANFLDLPYLRELLDEETLERLEAARDTLTAA